MWGERKYTVKLARAKLPVMAAGKLSHVKLPADAAKNLHK